MITTRTHTHTHTHTHIHTHTHTHAEYTHNGTHAHARAPWPTQVSPREYVDALRDRMHLDDGAGGVVHRRDGLGLSVTQWPVASGGEVIHWFIHPPPTTSPHCRHSVWSNCERPRVNRTTITIPISNPKQWLGRGNVLAMSLTPLQADLCTVSLASSFFVVVVVFGSAFISSVLYVLPPSFPWHPGRTIYTCAHQWRSACTCTCTRLTSVGGC
jgi:hypothetical protein